MVNKEPVAAKTPIKEDVGAKIAALEAKLGEERARSDQLFKQVQFLTADFENLKKMAARQVEDNEKLANAKLLGDLLVVLDDLERATSAIKDASDKKGMCMILGNLSLILKRYGLQRMACVGRKLDPYYHEVLLSQAAPLPEGTVVSEISPGYTYQGRVLRHAKVCVSKGDTK